MKYLLLLLAVLALPVSAQEAAPAPEDWESLRAQAREMRARAKEIRSEAERTFQAADAACLEKIFVSGCREDALQAKHASEREAKRIDIEAGRIERRVAAHDRELRLAKKAERLRERDARAAERAEQIRIEDEARRLRMEQKQAEIERRAQSGAPGR